MRLEYTLEEYITQVKMSNKCRVLVEGKNDKAHFNNLLKAKIHSNLISRVKVDTAEQIKIEGNKCNRARIEAVYSKIKNDKQYSNLFLLCDREFDDFKIEKPISDTLLNPKVDDSFYLTNGHSFENYFFAKDIIINAFSYLTNYEFKKEAVTLFEKNFTETFRIISSLSLAARHIEKAGYFNRTLGWEYFKISNFKLNFCIEEWGLSNSNNEHYLNFKKSYIENTEFISATNLSVCMGISRGHTAVLILQRIFASCLYFAGEAEDENLASKEAKSFSKISQTQISAALSQSWLNSLTGGSNNYPSALIYDIAAYHGSSVVN